MGFYKDEIGKWIAFLLAVLMGIASFGAMPTKACIGYSNTILCI
ncbi:MAG: hypothetical protein ACOX4U_04555 [Anaerovoracaceae bacterium]|jgi:hypothetical protein